ncbi:MAG: hypothetical protein ACPG77_07340 [Nannocystaceae bacterium]
MRFCNLMPLSLCLLMLSSPLSIGEVQAKGSSGEWTRVTTKTVKVSGVGIEDAIGEAARDELAVYRRIQPRKAKVSNVKFAPAGPVGEPRLSFTAQGPLRIEVDIATDFTMNRIKCEAPAKSQGYQYHLDLRGSEEKLVAYITSFVVDICVVPTADDQVKLVTTTYLKKGPKYRRGLVSLFLHKFIKAQTAEVVRVLADRSETRAQASVGANRAPSGG